MIVNNPKNSCVIFINLKYLQKDELNKTQVQALTSAFTRYVCVLLYLEFTCSNIPVDRMK